MLHNGAIGLDAAIHDATLGDIDDLCRLQVIMREIFGLRREEGQTPQRPEPFWRLRTSPGWNSLIKVRIAGEVRLQLSSRQ
jgi:hypothetical protein